MHPELRLIEDFMTDKGAFNLPAQPRMFYVVRGAVTIGRRTLRHGEVVYSEETVTGHAEDVGATLWRWELSDPRQPPARIDGASVLSRDKLFRPLAALPEGELIWRGDSVAFPPGGCAYLHRHQGPGIRCLVEGELRVDSKGESVTYAVGDAWYEAGPDPVFAQAGAKPTRFIRVMILPRKLIGKSSIEYLKAEDRDKPKLQQYRVFVDAPLTWG